MLQNKHINLHDKWTKSISKTTTMTTTTTDSTTLTTTSEVTTIGYERKSPTTSATTINSRDKSVSTEPSVSIFISNFMTRLKPWYLTTIDLLLPFYW